MEDSSISDPKKVMKRNRSNTQIYLLTILSDNLGSEQTGKWGSI